MSAAVARPMALDWSSIALALGLVLVIEGLLPLLAPRAWRDTFRQLLMLRDGQLRFFGLCSVAAGLLLAWLAS